MFAEDSQEPSLLVLTVSSRGETVSHDEMKRRAAEWKIRRQPGRTGRSLAILDLTRRDTRERLQ